MLTLDERLDLDTTFRAERDGFTCRPHCNDFGNVLRDFTTAARLIAAMPADQRDELRLRLDQAMAHNDQQTALASLMVSLVVPAEVPGVTNGNLL